MSRKRVHGARRVWLPAVVMGLFALAIVARLVQVQVIDHDHYAERAEAELSGSSVIYAERGALLDRNGHVLATSIDTWDIYVNSRAWRDDVDALEASAVLGAALERDPATLRQDVRNTDLIDVIVARDVPFDVGLEIVEQQLPGVIALRNTNRVHPEDDLASGLLGITGTENDGLSGVEASLNGRLDGTPGRAIYERDTSGEPIPYGQYVATEPEAGDDVVLTIDRYLQQLAEETLAEAVTDHRAKGGAIIIMDPGTGELLALAEQPTIRYSELNLDDPSQTPLLRNRTATDLYEPGSVMKVVTAAAAIDADVVSPNTMYEDDGTTEIYDTTIRNWNRLSYGTVTMTEVLQHSINTGAVFMAEQLGAGRFHDYMDAFGFGQATGVGLPGEAEGIFREPGDPGWTEVDLATQSFGQAISVTPLQMTTAIAATINGGYLLQPRIVDAYVDSSGQRREIEPIVRGRPITEETSRAVQQMLEDVIYPGWDHQARPELYTAGGKSGTANVPIPNGTYAETQVASFVGFAPADDPEILILVKLDENADQLTGTQAAGPVFAKLVDKTLGYMNVPPDGARVSEGR